MVERESRENGKENEREKKGKRESRIQEGVGKETIRS
jgi:hypothetical protein